MTKKAALKAATASILVAAVTLSLGRDKETGERNRLAKDEELTADLAKSFGLSSKDVQSLVDDGKLVEKQVRAAASTGGADAAALAAAIQRADDAEKDYADLERHVETLEAQIKDQGEQIEALTKDRDIAVNAGLAVNDTAKAAEARVADLEAEIEKLTADLAEATKPADPAPAADADKAKKA